MQNIILNSFDYEQVKENIKSYKDFGYDIIPVFNTYSDDVHYLDRDIIGLFLVIAKKDSRHKYLILNDHMRSDTFSLELRFESIRYLDDFKYFRRFNPLQGVVDMKVSHWIDTGEELQLNLKPIKKYFNFYCREDVIKYIPESILFSMFSDYYDKFIRSHSSNEFKSIYTKYLEDLSIIDLNGIYSSNGEVKNPDYTFYNLTGRPNGTSLGYNYSAMEKSSQGRSWIVSRYGSDGFLAEVDFSSYHLYLIADILNYDNFKGQNVYEYFACNYLGYSQVTDEVYEKVKVQTFKALYSEHDHELHQYEFFKRLKKFKDKLINEYNFKGFVFSYGNTRQIKVKGLTRSKLFNYYLQTFETDNSMTVLSKLNRLLTQRETKIILYTYDSFLFDFKKSEGQQLLKDILNCFNFPVKLKCGPNYYDLEDVPI